MIIHDQIPRFAAGSTQLLTDEQDQGGAIESHIRGALSSTPQVGMVALLMGGIGSGKTTFLKRFFSMVVSDLFKADGPAILAMLDFLGASPDSIPDLDRFLWKRLKEILETNDSQLRRRAALEEMCQAKLTLIREAYGEGADGIRRTSETIYTFGADPEAFAQEVLRYYHRRGKMPIVVFDNVDQLGVSSQTHIFTVAERFAHHLGCLSILVMREESYCAAQLRKQLTAYTIRPYHLSSPSFRTMIRVRIDFATKRAAEMREQGSSNPIMADLKIHGQEILDFFEVLRGSVFNRNVNIARLIEAVSFGNMRIALELFNNFIISGATNTPEILQRFRISGRYSVPFHQFAKSVILGDYRYYKQSRSLILNLFDVTEARNASHFTMLRVLKFTAGNFGTKKSAEGFVDLPGLVNAMVDQFDNEEDTVRTVHKLIEDGRQLLELDTRRADSLEGAAAIRITSAGQYYMDFLAKAFAYLDLVWHDTPMASMGLCDSLARLMGETEMEARFRRVEMFLEYLNEQEEGELEELGLSRAGGFFYGPFMPGIRRQYEKEKAFIGTRASRARRDLARHSRLTARRG